MTRIGLDKTRMKEVSPEKVFERDDLLVVEEPLEIRLGYGNHDNRLQKSLIVTLRTPGNDFELALGFIFSEGIIKSFSEVENIVYCADLGKQEEKENVVRVELIPGIEPNFEKLDRNFFMNSSCGVCGKTSIDSIRIDCNDLSNGPEVGYDFILTLVKVMEEKQLLFDHTGGLHAAGLFDQNGKLIFLREDVGRHNAVDKIIGASLIKSNVDHAENLLLLSGRAGFELVQKAINAGIPIVAAVGAPSSLSVELAREFNLTLIGFLREKKFNIYSGPERIGTNHL